MNHATSNPRPILLIVALASIVAAGFLICRPGTPASSKAVDPVPTSADFDKFFAPPPARPFPNQDDHPRGGRFLGYGSLPDSDDAQPTESLRRRAESLRKANQWRRHITNEVAIAVFVLQGPPPARPLLFLSYYVRLIPVLSSPNDSRARELQFHSEDLKNVPEIWKRVWEREMPDLKTPYRMHGGVI